MPMEIAVRGLFATLVAAVALSDAEARDALLYATILERQQHASIQSSNAGGWHSSRDLEAWVGPNYDVDDGGAAADPAYAPTLRFAGDDGQSAGSAETIQPKLGLLFLFPSWLMHQVRPYRGTGLRVSIAFNLGVAAA
jgi:hypothetical protein